MAEHSDDSQASAASPASSEEMIRAAREDLTSGDATKSEQMVQAARQQVAAQTSSEEMLLAEAIESHVSVGPVLEDAPGTVIEGLGAPASATEEVRHTPARPTARRTRARAPTTPIPIPDRFERPSRYRRRLVRLIPLAVLAVIAIRFLSDVDIGSLFDSLSGQGIEADRSEPDGVGDVPETAAEGEAVLLSQLQLGDCFNVPGAGAEEAELATLSVEGIPCDRPHGYETFAIVLYPAELEEAFPGDAVLGTHGASECADRFAEFVGASWFEAGYDISAFFPNEEGWQAGDRTIQCALTRLDGQSAAGSARASGAIVPEGYVSLFRLEEGDCFDDTDWVAFGSPVSCEDPHDNEVYAVLTSPAERGADYPDADEVSSSAFVRCAQEFAKRVDPELAADLDHGPFAFPLPLTWALGHRTYVCALWARDLTKLTASQQLAHTRFDALISAEFEDRTYAVSFSDFASVDGLDLVGSAHQANQVLSLTTFAEHTQRGAAFQDERPQRGAAWFGEKVPVGQGFRTAFVFQLEMYSWFTVGDGFAFVIQGDSSNALGEDIGYNGIGYNRIPNSVAVEFDTLRQSFLADPGTSIPDAPDLLANHISVQTRGVEPNDAHTRASLGWADLEPVVMADRTAHVVLIRYVPGEMTVFVDRFETPVLTVNIDLSETLRLDAGSAYAGFTASSGPAITGHKVLGWEFASDAST